LSGVNRTTTAVLIWLLLLTMPYWMGALGGYTELGSRVLVLGLAAMSLIAVAAGDGPGVAEESGAGASAALVEASNPAQQIKAVRLMLVHRLISGRHTAVGDLADFQGASDRSILYVDSAAISAFTAALQAPS